MTIAINRLASKSLVERVRDASDKRVVRVRLTEKGQNIAAAHQRFHERMVEAVVEHLDEEQMAALTVALEDLRGFFNRESSREAYTQEFEKIPGILRRFLPQGT